MAKEVHRLAQLEVQLCDVEYGGLMVYNGSVSSFLSELKEKQCDDSILSQLIDTVHQ